MGFPVALEEPLTAQPIHDEPGQPIFKLRRMDFTRELRTHPRHRHTDRADLRASRAVYNMMTPVVPPRKRNQDSVQSCRSGISWQKTRCATDNIYIFFLRQMDRIINYHDIERAHDY